MTSSSSTPQSEIYHEKEVVKPSQRFLLYDTKNGGFRVTCSRAVLNCLLQRAEFKRNVELDMQPSELEHTFNVLQLHNHFKLDQMDQWLDSKKGKLLSSILAISKTLWSRGVSLSPVDDVTYTSLVERPCGYICSVEEGWVVLRSVSDQWYQLDPRSANITRLSDTHLHMIIKQLLLENEPIFRVSGRDLSTLECDVTPAESAGSVKRRAESAGSVERRAESAGSVERRAESAGSVERRAESAGSVERRADPEPPDPDHRYLEPRVSDPHRERRDEVIRMLTNLTRLHMRISPHRSPSIKSETRERSRSVTRDEVLWRSASQRSRPVTDPEWPPLDQDTRPSRRPVTESRLVSDPDWPPLDQGTRPSRRRRARSSPRSSQQQRYHPPRDGARKGEEKRCTGGDRSERSVCCICLESDPDHALYPCGHQCLCLHCKTVFLTKFKKCPICNKYVTDAIKIFRA